mmetsp:Transcript_33943/g.66775  ORF Transcript_33943/g.66775 Transcript_33943/m.66775 type:complete len:88 (-) Transcript_33943:108-371(-)
MLTGSAGDAGRAVGVWLRFYRNSDPWPRFCSLVQEFIGSGRTYWTHAAADDENDCAEDDDPTSRPGVAKAARQQCDEPDEPEASASF